MLAWARCLLLGHKYVKTPYPEADTADGFYLRCRRCAKTKDASSSGVDGAMGAGFM